MLEGSLIEVAAFVPVESTFTYRVDATGGATTARGSRVLVPFGSRRVLGVVLGPQSTVPAGVKQVLPVSAVLDATPLIPEAIVSLCEWVARYYLVPVGEVLRAALPAHLQAKEQSRVRITDDGRAVLAAAQAVLRRADEALVDDERAVLERLGSARGRTLALGRSAPLKRAVERLLARGFVSCDVEVAERGTRKDTRVELVGEPDLAELCRGPRQRDFIRALLRAGGTAHLGDLRAVVRDPRGTAARLAARGLVRLSQVELAADPFDAPPPLDEPKQLTAEQAQALAAMREALAAGTHAAFLLHGVTGSGKTEVYLQVIADVRGRGQNAIVLVPEIALTPQLAGRFRARFGDDVAVLHSGLTDAQRYGQWQRIRTGAAGIVVGARSAVFAPVASLGVIVVDEEHDSSFKQGEGVRYNGRDVALVRAQQEGAIAILGSATPSLESYQRASEQRMQLLPMRARATENPLPEVTVVDLRKYAVGPEGFLSAPLASALEEVLARGEQAILFLNRRGFATFVLCRACGFVFRCPDCSVSLTFHRREQLLTCHYCGFGERLPPACPDCSAKAVELLGLGTEQVEHLLKERFPNARVARMDRDTALGPSLRKLLAGMNGREIDILVGTQMVTKGHDFAGVTLVGVLFADLSLNFPDFRAAEHTFQLLTQVAGRAGRGGVLGKVIVQSYSPDHPSIHCAKTHDYLGFNRIESAARRELGYPPWGHLVSMRVDGADGTNVQSVAESLARAGAQGLGHRPAATILGPTEAPLSRIKGKVRWMLLVKGSERSAVRRVVRAMLAGAAEFKRAGVRVTVDVDPIMML